MIPDAMGGPLAILTMALATYGCRVFGVLLMSRMNLTPRVRRALSALPGSIVAATVVPIGVASGIAASAGILAAILVMWLVRQEVAALAVGLAVVAGLRAAGVTP